VQGAGSTYQGHQSRWRRIHFQQKRNRGCGIQWQDGVWKLVWPEKDRRHLLPGSRADSDQAARLLGRSDLWNPGELHNFLPAIALSGAFLWMMTGPQAPCLFSGFQHGSNHSVSACPSYSCRLVGFLSHHWSSDHAPDSTSDAIKAVVRILSGEEAPKLLAKRWTDLKVSIDTGLFSLRCVTVYRVFLVCWYWTKCLEVFIGSSPWLASCCV